MIGGPKAATSGQYDGDGTWMWSAAVAGRWTTSAPCATLTSRPVSSSVYLRCQNSSKCVIVGTST